MQFHTSYAHIIVFFYKENCLPFSLNVSSPTPESHHFLWRVSLVPLSLSLLILQPNLCSVQCDPSHSSNMLLKPILVAYRAGEGFKQEIILIEIYF